jgi:hypothetical protein
MTDQRRARSLLLFGLAATLAALAVAALLPGPTDARSPGRGFGQGPVSPGTALTPGWAEVAGLAPGIDPDSANSCEVGRASCLDAVVAEMEARFDQRPCAHTAPFAFTYLEMTREVGRNVAQPDFFGDPSLLAHLDALFAKLYFDAFDNWTAGRHDEVPAAWRIAFRAAAEGRTSAAGDVFLGMNAHISRDLAYAVAQVISADGGVFADNTDYLLVNETIAAVQRPMLAAAAERFDPGLSDLDSLVPTQAGVTSVDLIALWRQQAFELGQRLATARTSEERAVVEAEIERTAVAGAVMILNADTSLRGADAQIDRDGYCELRRG